MKTRLTLALALLLGSAAQAPLLAQADPVAVARLARDIDKEEGVRAVKTLQATYAQYLSAGLWTEAANLFAADGIYEHGDGVHDTAKGTFKGPRAIAAYLKDHFGDGQEGLKPGGLNNEMQGQQVVNVSADGKTAQGRWHSLSMRGRMGAGADWAGGIMENDFIKVGGVWKIAHLRYYAMFAGPYETGWKNVVNDLPAIPTHYTPDQAGQPVYPSNGDEGLPKSVPGGLAALNRRAQAMDDWDKVMNLQHLYGFYTDQKMWDDVTDLFTTDGVLERGGVGLYTGAANIRRALEVAGPKGNKDGELNEHIPWNVTVEVKGNEARSRGTELAMLGDVNKDHFAQWQVSTFEGRFVKEGGIWKMREMRIFPQTIADFYQGWGKSKLPIPQPDQAHAPDRKLPAADVVKGDAIPLVPFFTKVSVPKGSQLVGAGNLTGPAPKPDAATADLSAVQHKLDIANAYDGAENVKSAFGQWIDDFDWDKLGHLLAQKGLREMPFNGFYQGPEKLIAAEVGTNGPPRHPRAFIPIHFVIQDVIDVQDSAKSAKLRVRLFQLGSSLTPSISFSNGYYPNDWLVKENGIWKLWNVAIDEFYWQTSGLDGWSKPKPTPAPTGRIGPRPGVPAPQIPSSALGERKEGFAGGMGRSEELAGMEEGLVLERQSGQRTGARELLARLLDLQIPSGNQRGGQRVLILRGRRGMFLSGQKSALGLAALFLLALPARAADSDQTAVARLARDVDRAEAIRAVKTVQTAYSQYSQFGLWHEMAALFATDGEAIYGKDDLKGSAAIGAFYKSQWGDGQEGLKAGALHTRFDETPVINLSADGKTAKGRWHEFSMLGKGDGSAGGAANWAQGIMENDYVKQNGVWKISRLHYYPVSEGSYETGWKNAGGDVLPIIPYHFTATEAGVPIPALADNDALPALKTAPAAALAALNKRIRAMNETDKVANLQNAYGYYTDRMMWDDAADLFTPDAVLEDAEIGVYAGVKSIRHSFDRIGPLGLARGLLNDRPTFDLAVWIAPGGTEARTRGLELREIGDVSKGTATLGLSVFENRFVKGKDGKWRIREMRFFPHHGHQLL